MLLALLLACSPSPPPGVVRLSGLPASDFPGMDDRNTDMDTLEAERPYVRIVETADLPKLDDEVHYSRLGFERGGAATVEALEASGL